MPFTGKCTVAELVGEDERFHCRFGYKVGDYFIYDDDQFIGRVSQAGKGETRIWLNFGNESERKAYVRSIPYHLIFTERVGRKEYDCPSDRKQVDKRIIWDMCIHGWMGTVEHVTVDNLGQLATTYSYCFLEHRGY